MIQETDIESVSFSERMRYAIRAFMHIVLNRPLICYFDDSTIYARTNVFYMKAAAEALADAADAQIAQEIMQDVNELIGIPKYRRN